MALKDLLVCIDPTSAGDGRVKLAFNLARANKAHLSGAYVLMDGETAPRGPSGFGVPPAGPVSPTSRAPAGRSSKSSMMPRSPIALSTTSRMSCGWPVSRASGTSCPTVIRPN